MTAANADDFLMVRPGPSADVALAMLEVMLDEGLASGDAAAIRRFAAGFPRPRLPSGVSTEKVRELARVFAQSNGSVALAGPVGATGIRRLQRPWRRRCSTMRRAGSGRRLTSLAPTRSAARPRTEQMRKFLSELTGRRRADHPQQQPGLQLSPARRSTSAAPAWSFIWARCRTRPPRCSEWVLPIDSPLESWGDYEPRPGVHGLMQPMIRRLHDTRPAGDVLLSLAEAAGKPISREGRRSAGRHVRGLASRALGGTCSGGTSVAGCAARRRRLSARSRTASPRQLRRRLRTRSPDRLTGRGRCRTGHGRSVAVEFSAPSRRARVQPRLAPGGAGPDDFDRLGQAGWTSIRRRRWRSGSRTATSSSDEPGREDRSAGRGSPKTWKRAPWRSLSARGIRRWAATPPGAAPTRSGCTAATIRLRCGLRKTGRRAELAYACATQDQHHREILQWTPLSKLRDDARRARARSSSCRCRKDTIRTRPLPAARVQGAPLGDGD